ncbi:probable serine/threonine-protein kinase ifkA [Formica exsecta]|uniref:probable serine/threonine-protein kinase ifkA n=1 Tax=Formica exsecta TaxID=72781 RepID=UPI0011439D32|nr:probable serine/threonine-protein kinase ifkA [Formica exsecta]XP_029664563.1 probable serine/threonine-protein kinase ifkA [Formica exsecta]
MDKSVCDNKLLNKKPLIPQRLTNNNHSQHKTSQSVAAKNNENNIDYRNISLTLTGEISSSYIHRDNLTQKQPNIMLVEDTEDDDEQFFSNMKEIIDKNYKMQNKENHSIRDLQSKSYLSKKKKCVFSDEDQNLIKRFKKSVNENKVLRATSEKLQQSESVATVSNSKCSMITSTPKITSAVTINNINTDFSRSNTNQFFSDITLQKNDQLIMPRSTGIVTKTEIVETEIEQLVYCEMHYLTPPQRDK